MPVTVRKRPVAQSYPHPFSILLAAALLFLAVLPVAAGEKVLRVYAWSDYFDMEVLAEFEERHGCTVAIDTFDSNENMLDDLLAGGAFDIATPTAYMATQMERHGLLAPFRHDLLPHLGGVDADFSRLSGDPGNTHSVPYARTVAGVGYNRASLKEPPHSWGIFGDSALRGRMTMLKDMRESLGAALKFLGFSLNTLDEGELSAAAALLRQWRGNLARFEVDEGNVGLGSGQYDAVHAYNGDVLLLMQENRDIDFYVPEEGAPISIDVLVVLKGSEQQELAHAFIDHVITPEVAARNMASILYYMPIPDAIALLDPGLREHRAFHVPREILDKCEPFLDLGDGEALYERAWETVFDGE